MSEFFEKGTSEQFEFALSIYHQTLLAKADSKNRKSIELVHLDNWFQNDLPNKIQSRDQEAHITHEELVQTITWKLARGEFRPRLKEFVTSNPPSMVIEVSKKSIKDLLSTFEVESSIQTLCKLKGVGPALASAVLSAAAPHIVPFMADECLLSIPAIGRCEYTIKEFVKYVGKIGECVVRLNSGSQGITWTPHKVELALWAHCVASDLKPELLPIKQGRDRDSTKVSENADEDVAQEMEQDLMEVTRLDGSMVPEKVKFPAGEHFLGRGPLLQIADTKISRKHAKIDISDNGDVEFTALHANPCFVREQGGQWTSLSQHRSWIIKNNLEIKFTENLWHFKFSVIGDTFKDAVTDPKMLNQTSEPIDNSNEPESEPSEHKPTASTDIEPRGVYLAQKVLKEQKEETEPTDTSIEPEPSKPATLEPKTSELIATKSPKKRQLPDWLLKLTADNGVSPLPSSSKKRKHDSEDEDEETSTKLKPSPNKYKTPSKSPKIAKNPKTSVDTSEDLSLSPSTSKDSKIGVTTEDLSLSPSTSKDSKIGFTSETPGILTSNDSSLSTKAKTPNDQDTGSTGTEFPVLITAEDLQDSDDEGEKENKNKQKIVKKKVEEASRPCCPHGASCYRKNPAHFTDEAHPGDPDFKDPDDAESDDERPECEFGTDCYRKNPDHKRNFKHSHKPQPKRTAKGKAKKKIKAQGDDDLDDSFLDDDSEESIDDTDEDGDYEPELNSSQD